jgi:conjugal transfer pilus assembly protein TrbC
MRFFLTAFCFMVLVSSHAAASDNDPVDATGISADTVKELNARAEVLSKQVTSLGNKHEGWARDKASEFVGIFNSPEFQARVKKESDRIRKDIFSGSSGTRDMDGRKQATRQVAAGRLARNERVYVFVSSSMPAETLRNYAASIDKLKDPNIVMVIRGFVNGIDDIDSTMKFVSSVLTADPLCDTNKTDCPVYSAVIEIDPFLFKRYKVEEVPVVVYAPDVQLRSIYGSEGIEANATVLKYFAVRGDAGLDYHLERISRESKSAAISGLVDALRKGFY